MHLSMPPATDAADGKERWARRKEARRERAQKRQETISSQGDGRARSKKNQMKKEKTKERPQEKNRS